MRVLAGEDAGQLGDHMYTMARCIKPMNGVDAHRVLHCTTGAGIGRGLVLSVAVHGLEQTTRTCYSTAVDEGSSKADDADVLAACGNSTLAFVSYALPSISAVRGADGSDTRGGQSFTVEGAGFGPGLLSPMGSVTSMLYAPAADGNLRYDTTASCRVSVDDREIECVTLPGTGMRLQFLVSIAGQEPAAGPLTTSHAYAQPVLATFDGEGAMDAETPGGQVVILRGNNFGPMVDGVAQPTPLSATYDLEVAGTGGITFIASACSLVEAHVTIECLTAEGAGRALAW